MKLKALKSEIIKRKRILMRVDFNVPLDGAKIADDTRMRSALPTINFLLDNDAEIVLMSHLGRPGGQVRQEYSMAHLCKHLGDLTGAKVIMAPDVVGESVEKLARGLKPREILLLENTRFYREETANDPLFSSRLAALAEYYVNDAFGAAHRAHSSTEGVAHLLPSAAGLLMQKECQFFDRILNNPSRPLAAVIGGAKVSSKIAVLESLLDTAELFVIGGGMAYTFLHALGHSTGQSLLEKDYIPIALNFLEKARQKKAEVILPLDHLVADRFEANAMPQAIDVVDIPDGRIAMDIGPKTLDAIALVLRKAQTVVWNGPMGVFEFEPFACGTLELARMVADCSALTVVGGGDSVSAVNKFNLADKIDHVSTGGGASLEYLEGKLLPGVVVLKE